MNNYLVTGSDRGSVREEEKGAGDWTKPRSKPEGIKMGPGKSLVKLPPAARPEKKTRLRKALRRTYRVGEVTDDF